MDMIYSWYKCNNAMLVEPYDHKSMQKTLDTLSLVYVFKINQ